MEWTEGEVLIVGELEIRRADHLARAGGRTLALSLRELDVLVALARRTGHIVSRAELYAVVWGREWRPDDRSVDVYVHKLRTKLGAALPDWTYIHTHFALGYRLQPEPSHPFHTSATTR